jgi:phage terminase small subunit
MANDLAKTTHLNERQAAFVAAYVADCTGGKTPDSRAAMIKAGYSESYAHAEHNKVMRQPEVLAAIHLETARRIHALAPAALATIDEVRSGVITEGAKVRLDAAKVLLDRAGHIAPRARALGDGTEKTLGEMSLDELKVEQERLQSEILARAKVVNAQPDDATSDQAIDLLGQSQP